MTTWASEQAKELGTMARRTVQAARRTDSPSLRDELVFIARQQWRSALRYERPTVAFNSFLDGHAAGEKPLATVEG